MDNEEGADSTRETRRWPDPGPPVVDGPRVAVEIRLRMNGKTTLVGDFVTLSGGRIERLLICNGPPEA
jgi:hypothetical protein